MAPTQCFTLSTTAANPTLKFPVLNFDIPVPPKFDKPVFPQNYGCCTAERYVGPQCFSKVLMLV
jgi:hypothetical protein